MDSLDLFLFTPYPTTARVAEGAGISSVIVDWERHGKENRQRSYDTEINAHTVEHVRVLSDVLTIPVTVRVDPLAGSAATDIETALDAGAKILMLPMATSARDVDYFLRLVRGRAKTLIQIETAALADEVASLGNLGWDYAHVGLNDLMISCGNRSLWASLVDGTVERICEVLQGRRVGWGGVTVVGGGRPLPFMGLLREMARLGCRLGFLRRSYHREVAGRDVDAEIAALQAAWRAALARSEYVVSRDHSDLVEQLHHRCAADGQHTSGSPGASPDFQLRPGSSDGRVANGEAGNHEKPVRQPADRSVAGR